MRISVVFIAFLIVGCNTQVTAEQLTKLNGYWEIEKVILSDGYEKEYKMNAMVDFFSLEDGIGFRKKVQPLFDGSFDTSDDAQAFEIKQNGALFELHYKNELSEWVEEIERLDETTLILTNTSGVRYFYKKFESLKLDAE